MSTNSLAATLAAARGGKNSTTGTTGGGFPCTPAGYNQQKNQFITNVLQHESPTVRAAGVSDECVPSTTLKKALSTEQDSTVLRAILFNPSLPMKSILAFVMDDPRAEQFGEDEELEQYLVARAKA